MDDNYMAIFKGFVNDDLNTPRGLALAWDLLKDGDIPDADKRATLLEFDKVLALGLKTLEEVEIPAKVQKLVNEREKARKNNDWEKSDELRDKIAEADFEVKDTPEGPRLTKK